MFIVDTDDYGFLPNQETIDKMHEEKECSCHNPNVVNIDDYYEEIKLYLVLLSHHGKKS